MKILELDQQMGMTSPAVPGQPAQPAALGQKTPGNGNVAAPGANPADAAKQQQQMNQQKQQQKTQLQTQIKQTQDQLKALQQQLAAIR